MAEEIKILTNNWECAKELEMWKALHMDTLDKEVQRALEILHDPNQKWIDAEQKKRAEGKYQILDRRNMDYARLYNAVKKLILQHEGLVEAIASAYVRWYNNVAYEGEQQKEMMQGQADILNEIFSRIFEIIQPLGLDIKPPKKQNDESK